MTDSVHSHKDYTGRSLADRPASEFTGTTVRGTCFSQETPDSAVFPSGVTNCTLIACNLDNVLVPAGFSVVGCSRRRFKAQPDGLDWIVDNDNNPVSPL